ncbi:unnamed protein product [Polarella glacialis]|uniref:Uncharacterized protein n=1 Tax=Polarella glacialis TaxID=89957 RepID=A0A813GYZ8_POLGL|nr:unnamed protein product [Polarella glacialis]
MSRLCLATAARQCGFFGFGQVPEQGLPPHCVRRSAESVCASGLRSGANRSDSRWPEQEPNCSTYCPTWRRMILCGLRLPASPRPTLFGSDLRIPCWMLPSNSVSGVEYEGVDSGPVDQINRVFSPPT